MYASRLLSTRHLHRSRDLAIHPPSATPVSPAMAAITAVEAFEETSATITARK
jgi:hypothetical protein